MTVSLAAHWARSRPMYNLCWQSGISPDAQSLSITQCKQASAASGPRAMTIPAGTQSLAQREFSLDTSSLPTQLQERGVYKAMSEFDIFINYIETYTTMKMENWSILGKNISRMVTWQTLWHKRKISEVRSKALEEQNQLPGDLYCTSLLEYLLPLIPQLLHLFIYWASLWTI